MTHTFNFNFRFVFLSPSQEELMSKIDELNAKVDSLDAALADEKTQDQAKTDLIASLRAEIAGGLSADDTTALEAKLDALLAKAPDTVTPDAPAEPVADPSAPPA